MRDALAVIAGRSGLRDQAGRFVQDNTAATTTLDRSEAWHAAVAPAKGAIVGRVMSDLAIDDNTAPETLAGLIDGIAEARLLRQSLFMRCIQDGGPITSKRRTSAVYAAYLSALDREMKLAQLIGLERKTKPAESLAAVLAQHEEQR